jgi:hypothetical protein
VAITRTKETLVLSSTTRIPRELAHRMRVSFRAGGSDYVNTIASRFLAELGPSRPPPAIGEAILLGLLSRKCNGDRRPLDA